MEFLQRISQLLSEPPGNLVYYLVTLFALQVVFAIAYSQWRRDGEDEQARRLTWAAGGVFVTRVLLLLGGLFLGNDPERAIGVLPPLEYAVNTATAVLLIWSLLPRFPQLPNLLDTLLVALIALSGVMYLFFVQDWQRQVAAGSLDYAGHVQATLWLLLQLVIAGSGLAALLFDANTRHTLGPYIAGLLLFFTGAQLWSNLTLPAIEANAPYLVRFGQLVVFALWAVFVYQRSLSPLLAAQTAHLATVRRFGAALEQASGVIATPQVQRRLLLSLEMAGRLTGAEFVAIGLLDETDRDEFQFASTLPDADGSLRSWILYLSDWSSFQTAFAQRNTVELLREGLGARQLYQFYQSLELPPGGPLLIQPLLHQDQKLGLLICAAAERQAWSEEVRLLLPGLARFLTQTVVNARRQSQVGPPARTETPSSAMLVSKARMQALEAERERLNAALAAAEDGRHVAETRAARAEKQARALAAVLQEWQKRGSDPDALEQLLQAQVNAYLEEQKA